MIMPNIQIHPQAIVETPDIGENTRIWAFVHVLKGAVIGKNNNICDHCFIENGVKLGDDVTVKSGVYLWKGITAEDGVFIGPAAAFTNDLFPRSKNTGYEQKNTLLKKGCSIGANATILAGITVGQYAMVGAGAVVTKDVHDFTIVYGNPAVEKGYACVCGKKLRFKGKRALCSCGKKYEKNKNKIGLL
jgi:acetyltransferase-like isoleucine patch superfamily enzyme